MCLQHFLFVVIVKAIVLLIDIIYSLNNENVQHLLLGYLIAN